MTDYGVDISHHNEVTDWAAVKSNGVTFGWAKTSQGTEFLDPARQQHIAGFRSIGARTSGYHYAMPGDAEAQVKTFVACLNAERLLEPGNLVPALDVEDKTLRSTGNQFTVDFIRAYRALSGQRKIVVYANLDWFVNILRPFEWADNDVILWIARYGFRIGYPGWAHPRLGVHQYTSTGGVRGIVGNVDCDATMPGWTLDQLTIPSAPAPGADTGGIEIMERITVTPPNKGQNTVRVLLSGSPAAALVVRPKLNGEGFSTPMWVGNIFAWGSDHQGIGHNPKSDPNYNDRLTSHRRFALPGAVWADVEYSAADPFQIDIVG